MNQNPRILLVEQNSEHVREIVDAFRDAGWSWVDALFFNATSMSTVGLGDLSPQTDFGKLFTVIYIFAGVGVFVALFAQFARALLNVHDDDE